MGFHKYIVSCINHYSIMQNSFPKPKTPCDLPIHPSFLPSKSLAMTDLPTVSIVMSFPACHMVDIKQYVAISSFFHFAICTYGSFTSLVAWYLISFYHWVLFHWMHATQIVYPFTLKNILIVSIFWQLWIKLPLTFLYRILCGQKFSAQLGNR